MENKVAKSKAEEALVIPGRSLVDLVFSWSIGHVLNKDLYKNQVCMHAMFMCMMRFRFLIFYTVCFSGQILVV